MFVIVSYDISNTRTRTRLAKKLEDFGPRVQFSVFEGDINRDEFVKLTRVLSSTKLGETDSIRFYTLCSECKRKIKIWGTGKVTEDNKFYIV